MGHGDTNFAARHCSALSAGTALGALSRPHVARAQAATLKITTWGGKWGEVMKGEVIPAFEKEFKCKVEADQAFPYLPKLQASAKNAPVYDVLHANSNEQWQRRGRRPRGRAKITAKEVPNIKDVYPYAVSATRSPACRSSPAPSGFGYRTDKGLSAPKSWKDLADPKLAGAARQLHHPGEQPRPDRT